MGSLLSNLSWVQLPVHVGVGKGKSTFLNMSPWHRIGLFFSRMVLWSPPQHGAPVLAVFARALVSQKESVPFPVSCDYIKVGIVHSFLFALTVH